MAKIIKPLSPVQVKNAKPKEKNYRLFDGGGIYLEVTTVGSKLWRMKYLQANGKENRLFFGKYPDVSLEQARQKRDEARKLRAAGIDTAEVKKRLKALISRKLTIPLKKQRVIATTIVWRHGSLAPLEIIHRLEKDIFPAIGTSPISQITHKQLNTLRKEELMKLPGV